MRKWIERKAYLEQLAVWREEEMIKVVTGVRKCGKSALFELYIERLKAGGVTDEQIILVNLEDEDYLELLDYKKLHEYVTPNSATCRMRGRRRGSGLTIRRLARPN